MLLCNLNCFRRHQLRSTSQTQPPQLHHPCQDVLEPLQNKHILPTLERYKIGHISIYSMSRAHFILWYLPLKILVAILPLNVPQVAAAENCLKPVGSTKSAVKDSSSKVRDLDWDSNYYLRWSYWFSWKREQIYTLDAEEGNKIIYWIKYFHVSKRIFDLIQACFLNIMVTLSDFNINIFSLSVTPGASCCRLWQASTLQTVFQQTELLKGNQLWLRLSNSGLPQGV